LLNGRPWPVAWSNVWVPFETWARLNGLGAPVQTASGPETTFTVGTPQGMLRIKPGSQAARTFANDTLLGYAPRMVGGVPYVHSLDLQKTLQPLLSGSLQLGSTNRVIVIDPGHGGRDSGTRNLFGGENEKHFTLDWARRVERLLAPDGWKVILTRTNDTDLPLADRVAIADRAGADLFLSLHFNAGAQNTEMSGIETYCLTPTGLPSSLRRDFEDDPRETLPNNAHDQANLLVATRLHRSLLGVTGAPDRGVRRARFMTVLRGQNRPAVLIEGGYLSNAHESRRVGTPTYRQSLAEAVVRALRSLDEPHPQPPASDAAAAAAAPASTPAPGGSAPSSSVTPLPAPPTPATTPSTAGPAPNSAAP
jgi:N-acetylmuramoyl-L-alanine amidase